MKQSTSSILITIVLCLAGFGCDGESTKEATSGVVGGIVEQTKGVVTGIGEGINEGRENVTGVGGTTTVTNAEAVHAKAGFEAKSVTQNGRNFEVVVAVTNKTEEPLHIGGLHDENTVVALDAEGFASTLGIHTRETIAIPSTAKVRHTFLFRMDSAPAKMRIYGQELNLPAVTAPAAEAEATDTAMTDMAAE